MEASKKENVCWIGGISYTTKSIRIFATANIRILEWITHIGIFKYQLTGLLLSLFCFHVKHHMTQTSHIVQIHTYTKLQLRVPQEANMLGSDIPIFMEIGGTMGNIISLYLWISSWPDI